MNTSNKTIEATLETLGLNEREVKVYLTLLSLGNSPAADIITNSGLKKGNTYDILYRLEEIGLIKKFQKEGKMIFQVEPPNKLVTLADNKHQEVEAAQTTLNALLPKLNEQYQDSIGKPTIRYYEGEKGIKQIFEDIFSTKNSTVYGCADLDKIDEVFPSYILKDIIPKRMLNNIRSEAIFVRTSTTEKLKLSDESQNRNSSLIDGDEYPLPAEIDVYEDKVALLTFEKDRFIGLIIQNEAIATTLKSLIRLAMGKSKSKENFKEITENKE